MSPQNEARSANHAEVVEEAKRAALPSNWEARKRRAEWELEEEKGKQAAAESGNDWQRTKMLKMSASELESMDRRRKKKNPDVGFSTFEAATERQYNKLVKNIKPDMNDYEREREVMGEAFYPTAYTVVHGLRKDSKKAIDRLASDIEAQAAKRDKFSRRRKRDPDSDVDYINERNMKFNQKLQRFYGEHTEEIKQNLERGTAI